MPSLTSVRHALAAAALLTVAAQVAPAASAAVTVSSTTSGSAVVNGSLEEDRNGDGVPDGWRRDAWGRHQGSWGFTPDARTGSRAYYAEVRKWRSGDRKLLATEGAAPDVQPGERYELSVWYKANTAVSFVVFTRAATGGWRYWTSGPALPRTTDWTEATFVTPPLPDDAVEIAHGLALGRNGIVKTDDYGIRNVDDNPFAGASLYADPASNAAREADRLRASDPARAELFDRIATQAQADWFGDWTPTSTLSATVSARAEAIRSAGALPLFVTYAIPARDCGQYSAGGVNSPDAYRAWIDAFATGLGDGPAVVVVEPDALAQLDCLPSNAGQDRLDLIRYAAATLAARPDVTVYLDAGNASWVPAPDMAERLRAAGVDLVRGVSLNVSNFHRTEDETAYAHSLSAALGGTHAVIDTSRNGNGPAPDGEWCNPPGRALGAAPGAVDDPVVDAHLWIKRPGESDGTCNGGPPAGTWWPEYAEELAGAIR